MQTLCRVLGRKGFKNLKKNLKNNLWVLHLQVSSFSGSSSTGSWIWSSYRSTRCRRSALNMNTIIFIKPYKYVSTSPSGIFCFSNSYGNRKSKNLQLKLRSPEKRDKVETRKIWSLEIIWFVWCLNYSALSVYPRVSHQLHRRGRLSNGVSKYKETAEL